MVAGSDVGDVDGVVGVGVGNGPGSLTAVTARHHHGSREGGAAIPKVYVHCDLIRDMRAW